MTRFAKPALVGILVLLFALPLSARERKQLLYSGRLNAEDGSSLGGVYALEFSLHRSQEGSKKVWTERHWVSIEDGVYTVHLGLKRALPRKLEIAGTWISVSLSGGPEIVREPLSERNVPGQGLEPPEPTEPSPATASKGGTCDYADKAGLAYEAEQCRNAEAVGNLSLEQLDERYRKKSGGAHIGAARRYSGSTGGDGGRPFRLVCPKGYVVVGIRGASAKLVDSLELICAPIE